MIEETQGWWREFFKRFDRERSPGWSKCRKEFIKKYPECAVCGSKKDLNVHHVIPFQISPGRELDETNLITLCRKHHLIFGHLGTWKSWNNDIRLDARKWRHKFEYRPTKKEHLRKQNSFWKMFGGKR